MSGLPKTYICTKSLVLKTFDKFQDVWFKSIPTPKTRFYKVSHNIFMQLKFSAGFHNNTFLIEFHIVNSKYL